MEQKLQSNAMEEAALLDKLWERYELSHSAALEQRVELESVPKATRRIAELNREIKGLGTPTSALSTNTSGSTPGIPTRPSSVPTWKRPVRPVGVIEEPDQQMICHSPSSSSC